jgi:hypothetical protein
MPESWSREEVEATVADYFEMLGMDLRGIPYNKAEHNRNLQKLLNNRSKGAVELKHQNISAVLIALGYPYIDGYKPRHNYQQLLYTIVEQRLTGASSLQVATKAFVENPEAVIPSVPDILSILVDPPKREKDIPTFRDAAPTQSNPTRKNYLETESRNRSLGLAGENFILNYEHERLWRAGKHTLADRIQHVAVSRGDHLGFDVWSYETDGRDRLIEVKTTRFGASTPFFASRNEVAVSAARDSEYQLYRLFNFERKPGLYVLPGSLRKSCTLEPVEYTAMPA